MKNTNMETNFDYQSVPSGYLYCFNNQCIKKEKCLRHLVAVNCATQRLSLSIINPNRIPADTSACPYFHGAEKVRMAWGFKPIFDQIPYRTAKAMRQQIIKHFGKTAYYRFYRQECPLMPEDQAYICRLFSQNGIQEEPEFERYTYQYNYNQKINS